MQHVIGVALIVVGGLFGLLGLLLALGSRRGFRAARNPRRALVQFAPNSHVELGGTLVNSPSLLTPLTGQACIAWHVSLDEEDSSGETTTWPEVWSLAQFGDMEIQYDVTLTEGGPPTPVGGVAKVAGEAIGLDAKAPLLAGQVTRFAPTPETVTRLAAIGLPPAYGEWITKYPKVYRVSEARLTTGDFVRGYQQAPRLDPHARFTLIPTSQEATQGFGCGCLALFAFAFAALAALLGIVQFL